VHSRCMPWVLKLQEGGCTVPKHLQWCVSFVVLLLSAWHSCCLVACHQLRVRIDRLKKAHARLHRNQRLCQRDVADTRQSGKTMSDVAVGMLGCFTIEPMAQLTALSISICSYSGFPSVRIQGYSGLFRVFAFIESTHGKLYASCSAPNFV
jgi:hypothetical protein